MVLWQALQVDDLNVAPLLLQVLCHQPPVAVLRRRLATEQNGWHVKDMPIELFLDVTLFHQHLELRLKLFPWSAVSL